MRVYFARARLHLDLLRVRDQKQAVGQERQLRQHALEFVVDERVAFAVAEIGLVLDLVLLEDVVRAELVGVVDGVDDDRLEGVLAFGDFGAGVQQVVPGLDGRLINIERVQARLGGEEERAVGNASRASDFPILVCP